MRPNLRNFVLFLGLIVGTGSGPAALAAGDAANGAQLFKKCAACHSTEPGVNKVGPSLAGIAGKAAGGVAGYAYSPSLKAAAAKGLVWSEEALAAYLENPRKYLADRSGDPALANKMPFALPDAQQRADVAAYLTSLVAR